MDKYEVTNDEYARFAQSAGKPKLWYWPGGKVAKGEEKLPVHDVAVFGERDAGGGSSGSHFEVLSRALAIEKYSIVLVSSNNGKSLPLCGQ